jgi:hypothetical protein
MKSTAYAAELSSMSAKEREDRAYGEPTVTIGGDVDACHATLRVMNEDLDPVAVGTLLGASPTLTFRKGDLRGKRRRFPARDGL